ncbi:MAG: RNA methyltransferase [Vicinamibacterales bacterium]
MIEYVDDAADPRLESYRNVPDPELLRSRHRFIVEGRAVVARALASPFFAIESVLVTETALEALSEPLSRARVVVYVTAVEVVRQVTGFNLHRGCLAVGIRPGDDRLSARVDGALAMGRPVLVLERVADADNVGSVFRSASALGAGGVLLVRGSCDPLYRKSVRVSMGGVFDVPFAWVDSVADARARLTPHGYRVVALTPAGETSLDACPRPSTAAERRVALVVGTEGSGLSADAEAMADARVRIAMAAGVDSLNVSTAAAIAMHWFSVLGK